MSNTTSRVAISKTKFDDSKRKVPLASGSSTYYPGAFIGLNSSGYGTKFGDTAVLRFEGICAESTNFVQDGTVGNGSANGDCTIYVDRPRYFTVAIASAAAGDEGKPVFASDDQTGIYAPTGTYQNFLGYVNRVVDSTHIEVEAWYGHPPVITVSMPYLAAAVDQAYWVAPRPCVITKIVGRPTVAGTDGSAVTAAIMKAASGTSMSGGTIVHSGTVDLKGTIHTDQSLTLTSGAILATGNGLGIDFTGTLTSAVGVIAVSIIPYK